MYRIRCPIISRLFFGKMAIDTKPSFSHDVLGMDEPQLTRASLEFMTTDELVRIADSFGLDIPPGLERVFVIEELLNLVALYAVAERGVFPETANAEAPSYGGPTAGPALTAFQDAEQRGLVETEGPLFGTLVVEQDDEPLNADSFSGSVPFPKQYNITFVEVMIRDPLWAFALWEIKDHDRETFERMADFDAYCLRINPVGVSGATDHQCGFTVRIEPEDSSRYITFPSENTGGRFQVELCALLGDKTEVLAFSQVFSMPRLQERTGMSDPCFNKLALLSGAEEFPILRNPDRKVCLRYGQANRSAG
jgi:hypothetical protein